VLEAGLGARYDATTAARPEAVVLTNVGLDHAEYLGDSVEEISHEKLASLSPGSVLVLGTDDATVRDIARRRCAEVDARLVEAPPGGDGTPVAGTAALRPSRRRARDRAAEELLGRKLATRGARASGPGCRRGVAGRFEAHEVEGVPVVVDGGHNASGVEAALEAVRAAYGGRPLAVVFGVLRDKDAPVCLPP
jgi:dihydrofolate synthase/folylpolyglutamate synthase